MRVMHEDEILIISAPSKKCSLGRVGRLRWIVNPKIPKGSALVQIQEATPNVEIVKLVTTENCKFSAF